MDKEKYILITGSSSGIGLSIAQLISKNHNIIVHGRNKERLNSLIEGSSFFKKVIPFAVDLEKFQDLENHFIELFNQYNIEVSGFVHCAGYMNMVPAKMNSIPIINKTFSINLFSAAIIVKILLQRKYNSKSLENIIFISSNISNFGAKAFSLYSSSKAGLDGLMRSLAVELAPYVRVNSILPGSINTPMTSHILKDKEKYNSIFSMYPLGEGSSEDISNMVDFLLSNKSKWITGQQFTVDGGRTINITG